MHCRLLLNSCCTNYLTPPGPCLTKQVCTPDMLLQQALLPVPKRGGQQVASPRTAVGSLYSQFIGDTPSAGVQTCVSSPAAMLQDHKVDKGRLPDRP